LGQENNSNSNNLGGNYEVISLYDLIQILIKRKKLIILVFMICVLAAVVGSLMMDPVYRVSASLYPGWIDKDQNGQPIYIASPIDIIGSIERESFKFQVFERLGWDNIKEQNFKVKADSPQNSKLVYLYVDSAFPKKAEEFMLTLIDEIQRFYSSRSNNRSESLTQEMLINNNLIKNIKKQEERILLDKKRINKQLNLANNRLDVLRNSEKRLQNQLLKVKDNTNEILSARNAVIQNEDRRDSLVTLLYSSTIQQNLSFIQHLSAMLENNKLHQIEIQNEIEDMFIQLEDKDLAIQELSVKRENIYSKGKKIKLLKDSIEGLKIVSAPQILPDRVKPNRTLMVALAAVLGLFLGIFMAFFKEFWQSQKKLHSS
jgi:uncharacterized protein involved in exopolysaccharide biosynthesis